MPKRRSGGHLFIHPSTRNFYLEGRKVPGYSLLDFLHGYIYGRWIYQYIALGKGDHLLAQVFSPLCKMWQALRRLYRPYFSIPLGNAQATNTLADGYHGKVVTISQASRLVQIDRPLNIPDLEQVIPYVRARALILQYPNDLAVLECPCRAAQPTHCQPLAVCLVVGKVFVDFMLAHHPAKSRRLTQAEAEEILAAEARRGHVHHAFFKDAALGRFYAICNCCACCCGAIKAHRRGIPMLAKSGYLARVDHKLCHGCGLCVQTCQFNAMSLHDGLARVDHELCMGCGVCSSRCVRKAVSLQLDKHQGLPLDIATDPAAKSMPIPERYEVCQPGFGGEQQPVVEAGSRRD